MNSGECSPIVLTGPGGWIGTAMLATIAKLRGPGWEREVRLFGSSERRLAAPDGTELAVRDLGSLAPADVEGAVVLHLAYLTKEKADQLGDRIFFETNSAIDDYVLHALADGDPRGVFVASSGAAALAEDGRDRHPYGLTKLRQEDRFLALGARRSLPVLAGRIFNIAGPYINKVQSYAVASFLTQARDTRRIRIDASVPVFRSYLHVLDLAQLVLGGLAAGVSRPAAFDLSGPEVVEMIDVARLAARFAGLADADIQRAPVDFSRSSAYLGDPTATRVLAMELGIELAPFVRQVEDTGRFLSGT